MQERGAKRQGEGVYKRERRKERKNVEGSGGRREEGVKRGEKKREEEGEGQA